MESQYFWNHNCQGNMMAEKQTLSEKYQDVSETLKTTLEMVTRIDERVGIFIDKLNTLEHKVENHTENCPVRDKVPEMIARISVLESQVVNISFPYNEEVKSEIKRQLQELQKELKTVNAHLVELDLEQKTINILSGKQEGRWKTAAWFGLQLLLNLTWVIIAAYILYHVGLQAPAVP